MKKNLAIKILLYLHKFRLDHNLYRLPPSLRHSHGTEIHFRDTIESLIGNKFIVTDFDKYRITQDGIDYIEKYYL